MPDDLPALGGLYRVTAPHFVVGLIVADNGRIVRAPPIVSWARGKKLADIERCCRRRDWHLLKVTEVAEENAS